MTYQEAVQAACAASKDEPVRLAWVYEMLDGDYQWAWEGEREPQQASRKAARIYRGRVTAVFRDTI